MARTLQVWVPDDLAGRVARAAEDEGRSISQWVRLLVERELGGYVAEVRSVEPLTPKRRSASMSVVASETCSHPRSVQRTTQALGTRSYCADPACGKLL